MWQQIVKTWRRIGRWRRRRPILRHSVRLEVFALEKRCTPATGIAAPLEAPVIVQVAVYSPVPPAAIAVDLAKPAVRADLFCSGFSVSTHAIDPFDDEPSEFSEPKPNAAPRHAEPAESNDVDATREMQAIPQAVDMDE